VGCPAAPPVLRVGGCRQRHGLAGDVEAEELDALVAALVATEHVLLAGRRSVHEADRLLAEGPLHRPGTGCRQRPDLGDARCVQQEREAVWGAHRRAVGAPNGQVAVEVVGHSRRKGRGSQRDFAPGGSPGFLAPRSLSGDMRVALVAMETAHHRDTRGTRRFDRLARQLADGGHDVTVFCAQWWDEDETVREEDGVRYRGVTLGPALTSFCARLPLLLGGHRPDVVHAAAAPPAQVLAASAGGTLAQAPLVVEWFGDEGLDPDARLTNRAVREPAAILTPSEMVRTEVRELGADDGSVRVIPESIEFEAVAAVEPGDPVDVVFAHPLEDSANIENFLLGLAELRDRGWRATVIGDGPHRDEYETQAAELRIDDRIRFVGECDREERLAIYRGAHAFVQTAYREQFPTELLWALACGCVGIVEYQARSSAHELIENYERSFRVTDPQELADAIVSAGEYNRLTADDTWAEYDHAAVRQEYVEAYDWLQTEASWL
jgi:glycosyltransferase involved in cell wall biosynthesis